MARKPPARTLSANLAEPKTSPATASRARSARLPTVRTVKILFSFILTVFIPLYFSTRDDVDIPEAGGNPEKEKNEKKPRLGAEPLVELEADIDTDGDRHHHGDSHGGNHPEGLDQAFFIFFHRPALSSCRCRTGKLWLNTTGAVVVSTSISQVEVFVRCAHRFRIFSTFTFTSTCF